MLKGIKKNVIIQPGGVIEIISDELPEGYSAEVIVIFEKDEKLENEQGNNFRFTDLIGSGKGCFKSAEDTDRFIREERDK